MRVGAYVVTLLRRGRVWWIQFREGGRRVRESLRTTNARVAKDLRERRAAEVQARKLGLLPAVPVVSSAGSSGVPPVAAPAEPEVASLLSDYATWSTAHKRPKTIRNDGKRLGAFFATVSGRGLRSILTRDVEAFLTLQANRGRKAATLLRYREILHAFWRWAVRQGHVEQNVVTAIPRPRLPERDPVFLSREQVDELLSAVDGHRIAPIVATAVFAGLRREELCWLTWNDLELDGEPGMLRVRAKIVAGECWQPKTKRDRRVPVSSRLRSVLLRHNEAGHERGVPWLFASPDGTRWDPDNLSRDFREVLGRHDLPWNLLELRHTFGSQLARKGVSLLKIAKLMGNSPAIASKHYINLVPEEMASDVEF